jgi:decaprenylphospho-beta-D-ribofuranose 2-oxidase
MNRGPDQLLTGWGRTAPSASQVVVPGDVGALMRLLAGDNVESANRSASCHTSRRTMTSPMIARGLGRSYGDAAQCAAGVVIDTSRFDGIGPIDPATGSVEVGGGVSLDRLIRAALPSGWFIPVSPGTRQVTLGGAIAADVHGKNHHRQGSFCSHVASFTLVTPVGTRTVNPESDPELFWATAGGMGLTGVVVAATLLLSRVETAWVEVDTERFDDLHGAMSAMEGSDHLYRYSVAWVDCNSHPRGLGRSVVTRGDHAPCDALGPQLRENPLALPRMSRVRVPFRPPVRLVRRGTARALNELWFRKAPRREVGALVPLTTFLHPLDGIADWNLLYGRGGFVQYQFVVPPDHGDVVHTAISMMAASRVPSTMAVLKRFGPGDPGPLSFPMEGWTLALDFPLGPPGLSSLLDRLDELVAGAGGRVYLAKDARLRPELVDLMYPRIGDLTAVRRKVDPQGNLRSDLSRRLGIDRFERSR